MILEPFYTENNWTTKNQVLAYQKRFEMQTLTEKYYQEKILFRVNVTNFWFNSYSWKFDEQVPVHLYVSFWFWKQFRVDI